MYVNLEIDREMGCCYRLHVGKDFPEELHFMSVNLLSINISITYVVALWEGS